MMRKAVYMLVLLMVFWLLPGANYAQSSDPVSVKWLDGTAPSVSTGVSWGVPWPRGAIQEGQSFSLKTADGESLPVQTWPMAYWPDGSIKWTGFAASVGSDTEGPLTVSQGKATSAKETVSVTESDQTYGINTGPLHVRIAKWGGYLIRSMTVDGKVVARNGELTAIIQNGQADKPWESTSVQKFISRVKKVTIEQSGPVRAVVKVEGAHKSVRDGRELIPFVVRMYFYAGRKPVRMVHSIIYDGDQDTDFIKGLGVHLKVPMREQVQNRHVRFSGQDNGLWAEPVQPLVGRGGRFVKDPDTGEDIYPRQLKGDRVPNREEVDSQGRYYMADLAVWSDFKLVQPNADGFTIKKRTNPQSAWISAAAGKRASGLVFAGDVSGGLGISLKDFWQSYPSSLEIRNADSHEADMYVWLWPHDAPVMDMRHYDTKAHGLESVYEDVQQGFSTPYGVARTSELTLYPTGSVPDKAQTAQMAAVGATPPVVTPTPEHLHSVRAFGVWSLPDRSTPFKRQIEDRLASLIDYYQTSIDQRNWYGYWNYGDVMHSYDDERHMWRYDLGGMAWDNTELMTDMWLWYSFLRTGREDIFRMAEAMTRHTQEVDVYHTGRFAGLGSRHNVRHWGGGAKEVRISQAPLKRFYYYLTTDERTGDLIREVGRTSAQAVADLDPMRLAQPIDQDKFPYPGRIRLGPDWLALAGNWMAMWEMTGDTKWKDLIYTGMNSIANFPLGFKTGKNLVVGFDPETGKLYQLSDEAGTYNLATIQGGGEVGIELTELVDNKEWQQVWLQYCRLRNAPKDVVLKDMKTHSEGTDGQYTSPGRLAAYAYMKTGNAAFAKQAIRSLTSRRYSSGGAIETRLISGPEVLHPVEEAEHVSTNGTAQSSLTAIEVLEMCADQLPDTMPE